MISGCSFSARTKTISRLILVSVYAALFFSPSLCVLLLLLLWISALFLLWFPGVPSPLFCSPFYRDRVVCPQTSPTFAGLLFNPRTRSWARDVVHDWIGLLQIFSSPVESGWRRQARLFQPATVPFRQKWIFSFWPLIFGNLTIGSQVIKNFFLIFPLD